MNRVFTLLTTGALLFATLPANAPKTNTYGLQSYGFGSGGTAGSSTATYQLEGIAGEISGAAETNTGSTSNAKSGYIVDQQAAVPKLLSTDNGSGVYYNKLHFVIDNRQGGTSATNTFPTDTKFLIQVSKSNAVDANNNFTGQAFFVQSDGTLNATYTATDYQTYSAWGSASGSYIIGLDQNTTYYIHLKALQGTHTTQGSGPYTESAYGPFATQATAPATLSFSLNTNNVSVGTLDPSKATIGTATVTPSLSTNGASGGNVYISSQNGGLKSTSTNFKINSATADLSSAADGFGVQIGSLLADSGVTPLAASPYNGTGNIVGIVSSTVRSLYDASGPTTNGRGTLLIQAKAASTDVAASDYQEVLTFIAAANF